MKKKGQALVEFIIILPVFIMLVLGVIDIGKILYSKIILEDKITEAISLYDNGRNLDEIKNKLEINKEKMDLSIKEEQDYIIFSLSQDIEIITPGLNFVFNNPYNLKVKRSINND